MKAARYSGHGGPEVLRYEEVPEPRIAPADVIVKVAACAVNRLDLIQRNGDFTLPGYCLPHIAGMDVAGEIVEVGREVEAVSVGDRVVINPSLTAVRGDSRFVGLDDRYGRLGVIGATVDGGYADALTVPEAFTVALPDALADLEAAPLLCAGVIGGERQ